MKCNIRQAFTHLPNASFGASGMSRTLPFIGRQQELETLEREWREGNGFIVVYGRRRVGKTRLIKRFAENKRALYFLASKEDEALNRQRFARDVATFTDNALLAKAHVDDWRTLFQALAQGVGGEPYLLIIDEFPYLASVNPAFPSIMQYVWDEILAGTGVTLVLCGSSVSMMYDKVLAHKSPLYGRRTAQLRLRPLSFHEVSDAFPEATFDQVMESYALTGGIPKYLEFMTPGSDIELAIEQNVLSTSGFLYEEPLFLLSEEGRSYGGALSILSAVALGNRKTHEIATFLSRKATDLSPYLRQLMELGLLERQVPFDERYPERSKNGLYRVADNFMRFWFTYVHPFRGELEMGNMRPSKDAMCRTLRSKFIPFAFEEVSAEAFAELCRTGEVEFEPSRIAGYWNRKGSVELDVCALDATAPRAFVGECKCYERKQVGIAEWRALVEKATQVPSLREREVIFGLFSHTGFSDELMGIAGADEHLVLVDRNARVA